MLGTPAVCIPHERKPADLEDSCTLICAAFVKIPQMVETFAADLEDHGRLTCMLTLGSKLAVDEKTLVDIQPGTTKDILN